MSEQMAGYCLFLGVRLSYILVLCGGFWLAWKWWSRVGIKCLACWLLLRSTIIFFLDGYSRMWSTDLVGWFMHATWIVDDGCCPGIDFLTPYYLGFEYFNAFLVWIWHSKYIIALWFVLAEFTGVILLKSPLKKIFGECTAQRVLILFETSPIVLGSVIGTQDEPILLLAMALTLRVCLVDAGLWRRWLLAFIVIGATKILAIFYLFSFFLARRWKGLLVLVLAANAYWLIAICLGMNPFDFRFGRILGLDGLADPILNYRGAIGEQGRQYGIWRFFSDGCNALRSLVMLTGFAIVVLAYIKTIFFGVTVSVRLQAGIACASLLGIVFQLFYPVFFICYWIPLLPFLYAIVLGEEKRIRIPCLLIIAWALILILDPPSASRWDLLRNMLYVGHMVVLTLMAYRILKVTREFSTTPWNGICSVVAAFRRAEASLSDSRKES